MTAEAADPTPMGPLDPVFACPGCGCLVVDQDVHNRRCSPLAPAGQPLGPRIVDWLDGLDPADLEQRAYAAAFDSDPTAAILAELRRQAAEL